MSYQKQLMAVFLHSLLNEKVMTLFLFCFLESIEELFLLLALTTVSIETLKKLVKRSELSPSGELSVFKAVCNWAQAVNFNFSICF